LAGSCLHRCWLRATSIFRERLSNQASGRRVRSSVASCVWDVEFSGPCWRPTLRGLMYVGGGGIKQGRVKGYAIRTGEEGRRIRHRFEASDWQTMDGRTIANHTNRYKIRQRTWLGILAQEWIRFRQFLCRSATAFRHLIAGHLLLLQSQSSSATANKVSALSDSRSRSYQIAF
jgi:hypothetical protein